MFILKSDYMWSIFKKDKNKQIRKECESVINRYTKAKNDFINIYKILEKCDNNHTIPLRFRGYVIPVTKEWIEDTLSFSDGICDKVINNHKETMEELL